MAHYIPNDNNGTWVSLRNYSDTFTIKPDMKGDYVMMHVTNDSQQVFLRPGYMIPFTDNKDKSLKLTQDVLAKPLSLIVNRDVDGHATGKVFMSDGISQSQIDNKQYEYYQFELGGKSFRKWNLNEN